jgi:hypothetical protein
METAGTIKKWDCPTFLKLKGKTMITLIIDGVEIPEDKILSVIYEEAAPKGKLWKPEKHESYFIVTSAGEVADTTNLLHPADNHAIVTGNYFKTRSEALARKARLYATQRVLTRLRELEGDWVADWSDENQNKHGVNYVEGVLETVAWRTQQQAPAEYYSTYTAWETVIKTMKPDVLLMFGFQPGLKNQND